jgi:signal transduction histidine kinase
MSSGMQLQNRQTAPLRLERTGRTILIVDDEEVIRDLCAKALSGYRSLQAGNGVEALRLLENEKVDVILTDVMMPEMNGLELLQRVKEQSPNQVVVMMTGYGDKEVILRSLKFNADDFITKPINLLQLKSTIQKALEKMSLREELIQLQKMDRLKTDFLGLISHKLKTPVTVISLFIQNLVRDMDKIEDPEYRKTLTMIQDESNYLGYLIQDLLHYSDKVLNAKPTEPQLLDLAELAGNCAVELRERAALNGRHLESALPDSLPPVRADRQQVLFCLRALIDNALKFSPEGSRILISGLANDQQVEISIHDNGPGISPENQVKVFEKFYQVDPDNTGQIRGFGLGLFYARQFLQEHGGRLDLESKPGTGTTVTLKLPRSAPSA